MQVVYRLYPHLSVHSHDFDFSPSTLSLFFRANTIWLTFVLASFSHCYCLSERWLPFDSHATESLHLLFVNNRLASPAAPQSKRNQNNCQQLNDTLRSSKQAFIRLAFESFWCVFFPFCFFFFFFDKFIIIGERCHVQWAKRNLKKGSLLREKCDRHPDDYKHSETTFGKHKREIFQFCPRSCAKIQSSTAGKGKFFVS